MGNCVHEYRAAGKDASFDHERLQVYRDAIGFVVWVEDVRTAITQPVAAVDHLYRASSSIPMNIAEASGKTSLKERCQFIDTACGSSLECAACLDVLSIRECMSADVAGIGKNALVRIVGMLIGFRKASEPKLREESTPYCASDAARVTRVLDHERLGVYRRSLDFVRWCHAFTRDAAPVAKAASVLDRASTSVVLNIAEGNGKFSKKDRCRFIGHSRTAALQAASHLDVICARDPRLCSEVLAGKQILLHCVNMLVAWERSVQP